MGVKYLVSTRFAFIQQIHNYISKGYEEYQFGRFPLSKTDEFLKLDKKMLDAYNADVNSDRRYYRRKKGFCNVVFLRCEDTWILLKTKGRNDNENLNEKQFLNLKENPLKIEVAKDFFVELQYEKESETYGYFIEKETYRDRREKIRYYIDSKRLNEAANLFNMLNGIPAWGGISQQKKMLKKYLVDYVKSKNQFEKEEIKKFKKQLYVHTSRKIFTVFDEQS